jgi:hypothetical protein
MLRPCHDLRQIRVMHANATTFNPAADKVAKAPT